jgi:hypothetical protein
LYIVRLTEQERHELHHVVKKLKRTGQKVRRVQILLKADADGPQWTDERIAEAFSCRTRTVERLRQRCVEQGFDETLNRVERKQPPVAKLLPGDQEARIIATRLGPPPQGYNSWTLRLLARKVVELEIVDTVSYETVRRMLKKWDDEPQNRVLGHPAESGRGVRGSPGRSVGTYEKPYDAHVPVVCMDEQPVQLLKETRAPLPATAQHGKRVDYEYERAGTAVLFMFTEPLAGWRDVAVRERKTKVTWAIELAGLLEGRYASCAKVILVATTSRLTPKGSSTKPSTPCGCGPWCNT